MSFTYPPQLQELMNSKGDVGKRWLRELPLILEKLKREWELELGKPFLKSYCNYVTRVITKEGLKAVLKISFPDEEFPREVAYLKLQVGGPIPAILKIDETIPALLLEEIQPATTLESIVDEERRISIAASLMQQTWLGKL